MSASDARARIGSWEVALPTFPSRPTITARRAQTRGANRTGYNYSTGGIGSGWT